MCAVELAIYNQKALDHWLIVVKIDQQFYTSVHSGIASFND